MKDDLGSRVLCHDRILPALREYLRTLSPGDRMEPMRTLARRFDVSLNTVRLALFLLAREGVVDLKQGDGCYVRRPAGGTPGHLAVLVDLDILQASTSHFYQRAVQELRLFFQREGASSRLYIGHVPTNRMPRALTCRDFMEDAARGLITGVAAVATLPLDDWATPLRERGVPIVGMQWTHPFFDAVVTPDRGGAVRESVRRIAASGRRRVALMSWGMDPAGSVPAHGGHGGVFEAELVAHGLAFNPAWVRLSQSPTEPGAGWSEFREIWAASPVKPDAILIADDVLFRDAWPAIRDTRALVPDDLMVAVLGNRGASLPRPFPITLLECDPAEFAAGMGGILLELLAGRKPANPVVNVPFRLAGTGTSLLRIAEMNAILEH